MKKVISLIILSALLLGCSTDESRQRLSRAQRLQQMRADSAALKVAVMPTIDCLPLFVARESGLFDTLKVDVRLRYFHAQMDCDTALAGSSVEMGVTDLVRAERLRRQGVSLDYLFATNPRWQLIANRLARIRQLKQLDDKMVAMARLSATDLLSDKAVDSAGLKSERVFKVQMNDVNLRLNMLLNNEMDALWLPEPQATIARLQRHKVLMDATRMDWLMGAFAVRTDRTADSARQQQIERLLMAYDRACDSINRHGAAHYAKLMENRWKLKVNTLARLPKEIRFERRCAPREQDLQRARQWLDRQ